MKKLSSLHLPLRIPEGYIEHIVSDEEASPTFERIVLLPDNLGRGELHSEMRSIGGNHEGFDVRMIRPEVLDPIRLLSRPGSMEQLPTATTDEFVEGTVGLETFQSRFQLGFGIGGKVGHVRNLLII